MDKKAISNAATALWQKTKSLWHSFWQWYKGIFVGRPWYVKIASGLGTLVVLVVAYFLAVYCNLFWLFGKSPSIEAIMNPKTNDASLIYAANDTVNPIGKYFDENRVPVKYEDVNPVFFTTLIDTEDERFYQHHGVDFTGMLAAAKDMVSRDKARGASTITQQLVKNMFRVRTQYSTGLLGHIPGVKILIMKSKEMILATLIEMRYSKKEILTMYANTVDFGTNAFGINTAARTYFNKKPKDLTVSESAVLVGLLKATSAYNPKLHPKASLSRRNVVLYNMVTHGHLSRSKYEQLSAQPIKLDMNIETPYNGSALYFRQAVADYLSDWCRDNGYDLYTDGLRIYSTIDTRMQQYAEQAVTKQMRAIQQRFNSHWGNQECWRDQNGQVIPNFIENIARRTDNFKALLARYNGNEDSVWLALNKPHKVRLFDYDGGHYEEISSMDSIRYMVRFMHSGFVAMDPATGYVKAWVGDVDFGTWKYDKVRAMRQPGSTFKLFVYATAMEKGMTPCDTWRDEYHAYQVPNRRTHVMETWIPHNANGYFTGADMSLRAAFAQSINSIAVNLGNSVGIDSIAQTAKRMGITSPIDESPSLPLGSSDVNLLELVNSYCTVVNDGNTHDPILVTKIVDRNGKVIYEKSPNNHNAIPYRTAFFMQRMLLANRTDAGGTTMALNAWIYPNMYDTDFGGKTGTSNNHSDAWFIGVSPKLVFGAWVGGEYRSIHFRTGALGQGSRTALPICGEFIKAVFSDPAFASLHAKFPPAKEDIDRVFYEGCQGVYKAAADTANVEENDSTLEGFEGDLPEGIEPEGRSEDPGEEGETDQRVKKAFSTPSEPVPTP